MRGRQFTEIQHQEETREGEEKRRKERRREETRKGEETKGKERKRERRREEWSGEEKIPVPKTRSDNRGEGRGEAMKKGMRRGEVSRKEARGAGQRGGWWELAYLVKQCAEVSAQQGLIRVPLQRGPPSRPWA